MTQPGRAAIEIVGDASKLGPQLERDAQRAIDNVDIDTTNISQQIGDGFRNGADDGAAAMAGLGDDVEDTFRRIRTDSDNLSKALSLDAEEIAARIGVAVQTAQNWIKGLQRPIEINRRALINLGASLDDVDDGFKRTRRSAEDATEAVTELGGSARNAFSRLGDVIASAGSALAGLGLTGTNPLGLATLALSAAAIAAVIPVIIGLAAALADLAGFATLLPAAIGGAAASIIVLTVAFNGFGDAITAVLDGDPEKIAEALEKLAPAAQQVVREFERVLPILREVGKEIQQGFFGQLVGVVEQFGTQTLPRLQTRLETLAAVLGRSFAGFGDLVNASENVTTLQNLLVTTSRITSDLGAAFTALGQAFFNAIDAGLPSLETLSTRLADAITSFAGFIEGAIADGSFQAFLDDAVATLDELLALGGAVGDLLGTLFGGTDDAGRSFIGTLTDITKRMTEFFKSAEGQDALEDFGEIMAAVGIILGVVVNVVRDVIDFVTLLDDIVNGALDAFTAFGDGVVEAWNAVTSAVSSGVDAVGSFFSDLGSDIADIWNDVVDTVSTAIDGIVAFVSSIPDRVIAFIESIPGAIAIAFNLLVDQVITAIAVATAAVIVFFTDIPGQIAGAIQALIDLVTGSFDTAETTVTDTFTRIGDFIESVPERLAAAWTLITTQVTETFNTVKKFVIDTWEDILIFFSGLGPRIGEFFQQATDAVVAKVTEMIEFVKGLRARILAALGNFGMLLYNAGANIIQGLIDGISSKIGQLRDKISNAVQEIRDHLPFSPARKGPLSGSGSPHIAGAVIAEMIAAGLDAGTPLITQAAGRAANATTSPFGAIGQAGVTPLTTPAGTAGGGSVLSPVEASIEAQPVFIVQIGNEEIEAFIDKRVDERVTVEVRRLLAGTRG